MHPSHSHFRNVVDDITRQISYHESIVEKLREKRQAAQTELDSLVYPVLTLPPEITAEFFLWCLPTSSGGTEWNQVRALDEAPMLLCHVCSAWRDIAFSTPALWANMKLQVLPLYSADLFRAWIARTRDCPLSVHLYHFGRTSQAIFETLVDCASRIQCLELVDISVARLLQMEQACSAWDFRSLQRLTIVQDKDDHASIGAFADTPLVREVFLDKVPPRNISLPWHQLTKFTGRMYSTEDCLEVLRLCPNLVECTFAAYGRHPDDILTHPTLQSLTFIMGHSGWSVADGTHLLGCLVLPALQSLYILDCDYSEFADIFTGFLSRSSPPLRKFGIHLSEATGTNLQMAHLLLMPELVELEIWDPDMICADGFFNLFTSNASFLPKLQQLALTGSPIRTLPKGPPSEESSRHLLATAALALTHRWQARQEGQSAELKSFRVVWSHVVDLDEKVLAPFKKLAAEGMNIKIVSQNRVYV
ncbi:hypothetical protein C8F04DRAFT_694205 [Mycena alexandri]|uniref:F-box domain-containing protein n=1 Tax=Mycena alexandri TaxID=1745969 RepID=A0AAD6SR29_9AGAR|nr:hypothetical protein C8F04DRAFT_694205 [Mycena alexandri]